MQVNPDNSRAMSAWTFLLFKLNTLQTKIVKLWVSRSHGVMTVVYRIYTTAINYTTIGGCLVAAQCHVVQINQSEYRNSYSVWKLNNNMEYPTCLLYFLCYLHSVLFSPLSTLVNSQLVCLPPVGILNLVLFIHHYLFILVLKSPDGEWPIRYTFSFFIFTLA